MVALARNERGKQAVLDWLVEMDHGTRSAMTQSR
jgi:hypothetical protein